MLRKQIKLISLLCIAIVGCKSERALEQIASQDVNLEEIRLQAAYHSEGLKFLKSQNIQQTKSGNVLPLGPPIPFDPTGGGGGGFPIVPLGDQLRLVNDIKLYAINNGWGEYAYLANIAFNVDELPTVSIIGTPHFETYEYYKTALDILDVTGSSESEFQRNLSHIYNSTVFQSLTLQQKEILTLMGEVLIDSYNYWSLEYPESESLLHISTKAGLFKKVFTKVLKIVFKDITGIISTAASVKAAGISGKIAVAAIAGVGGLAASAGFNKSTGGTGSGSGGGGGSGNNNGGSNTTTLFEKIPDNFDVLKPLEPELEFLEEEYVTVYFTLNRQLDIPKSWVEVLAPAAR